MRYDIMVSAGYYDLDTQSGSNFELEDANSFDLHSDLGDEKRPTTWR